MSQETTALIVDDNPFIIDLMTDLLSEQHPEVRIVGTAKTGQEALEQIALAKPQLVFLDVELPDMNGFEVFNRLKTIHFQIIFITAFSHYAIRAIRFNALDYLVKPIDSKELSEALKRFHETSGNPHAAQVTQALENLETEQIGKQILQLNVQEGELRLRLETIVRIEGERNYSYIHLVDGSRRLASKTLAYFEEILTDKDFFRCHRSHLVNRDHVAAVSKNGSLHLTSDNSIPISRRKLKETRNWFEQTEQKP